MQYWLVKSEPDVWSLDQQEKAGAKGATWDGVRNYQAANNLKKMRIGDLCYFYHSNIGKEIVGIVEVIKKAFIDKTDPKKRFVSSQISGLYGTNLLVDNDDYVIKVIRRRENKESSKAEAEAEDVEGDQ